MSYCRWSTDCHECDLYVYEGCDGYWHIHVAGMKRVSDKPRPKYNGESGLEAFMEYHKACDEWVKESRLEPIGLPSDGEDFTADTPEEAVEIIKKLGQLGYKYPESLERDLLEDG